MVMTELEHYDPSHFVFFSLDHFLIPGNDDDYHDDCHSFSPGVYLNFVPIFHPYLMMEVVIATCLIFVVDDYLHYAAAAAVVVFDVAAALAENVIYDDSHHP
jgi:hypothetical protein